MSTKKVKRGAPKSVGRKKLGRTTSFLKVKAHNGEPLNEAADAMAAIAA
jgi:hypothetical protein